jgi:hypothetical protein
MALRTRTIACGLHALWCSADVAEVAAMPAQNGFCHVKRFSAAIDGGSKSGFDSFLSESSVAAL